jgi:hypothetical protein
MLEERLNDILATLNCKLGVFHLGFVWLIHSLRLVYIFFVGISGDSRQWDWVKPLSSPNPHKTPIIIPLGRSSVLDIGKIL